MTNISRRHLFKTATAAGLAVGIPATQKAQAQVSDIRKIPKEFTAGLQSKMVYEPVPAAGIDLNTTGTFEQAASILNEGESINASHWGIMRTVVQGGRITRVKPFEFDYAPSFVLEGLAELPYSEARIHYPMVRESYLKDGPASRERRGEDRFVRVSWETALDLAAKEIQRVYDTYGPSGVYGSSYGWKSTGKLNQATVIVNRLLNLMGGFSRRRNSYSQAAHASIMPYVVGTSNPRMTTYEVILKHTERIVFWACNPLVTADVNAATPLHNHAGYFRALKKKGIKTYSVNPLVTDTAAYMDSEWIAPNPGTDCALMAAMMYELEVTGKADHAFLAKYCSGWEEMKKYLLGEEDGVKKTPEWAAEITGVPAQKIRAFAQDLAAHRTMIMFGYGMQRAQYGEQTSWMVVTLAAVLGQIGLPGGGFGTRYQSASAGSPVSNGPIMSGLPGSPKPVRPVLPWKSTKLLPVAAITEVLERPGATVDFDGQKCTYPDIHLVMWGGGNPFCHHPDTFRLEKAWKKPDTVIVADYVWSATARHADIVLPACTTFEHNDITNIGAETNDGLVAMKQVIKPQYESRSDYWIGTQLAKRLGIEEAFTEGRTEMQWIEKFYNDCRNNGARKGIVMPEFKDFWEKGYLFFEVEEKDREFVSFKTFREDPKANSLGTESGLIQIYSPKLASYGYDDCKGHPSYFEPIEGTAKATKEYPLAFVSPKSRYRMHSQLDNVNTARRGSVEEREPVWMNPADAQVRGLKNGDVVLVKCRRGACLCGLQVSDRIKPGVVSIQHGAWFEPENTPAGRIDVHGNANTIAIDVITSKIARGNVSSTGNVEVSLWKDEVPPVRVFNQPRRVNAVK